MRPVSRMHVNHHRSRRDARRVGPSALIAPTTMIQRASAQPGMVGRRIQRGKPATRECSGGPSASSARILASVPLPIHAESAVDEAVAAHRVVNAPHLSIKGARTYAHVISTAAVAVFPPFCCQNPKHLETDPGTSREQF